MIKDAQYDWPTNEDMKQYVESLIERGEGCVSLRVSNNEIECLTPNTPGCVVANPAWTVTRYSGTLWSIAKSPTGLILASVVMREVVVQNANTREEIEAWAKNTLSINWSRELYYYSFIVHDETLDKDILLVLNNVWYKQESPDTTALKGIIFNDLFECNKQKQTELYNKLKHLQDVDGNALIPVLEDIELENQNETGTSTGLDSSDCTEDN